MINLTSIYLTNMFGGLLLLMVVLSNLWILKEKTAESRLMLGMIVCCFLCCIADPICFSSDGKPGTWNHVAVFGGNFCLFLSTTLLGPMWINLISRHINGQISKINRIFMDALVIFGLVALAVNFFTPVAFSVDANNVYHRGPVYWIFTVIEGALITDGIVMYIVSRRKGGMLKFFPVWQFIVPAVIGIGIQSIYYGISTIWPCMAISMCSMLSSMQNEIVFQDRLTGVYNRFYLDNLKRTAAEQKKQSLTAMMLDMNHFKSINDHFGHHEGDLALITVANILKEAVGELGNVTRYAGDEFVVLLNTEDREKIESIKKHIHENFLKYNQESGKPYQLSIAIGYSTWDMNHQTIDELMGEIDRKMYDDKKNFYQEHPEFDRRRKKGTGKDESQKENK